MWQYLCCKKGYIPSTRFVLNNNNSSLVTEKSCEENGEDVMLLSESEHDSADEVDPCNESLEPTFKREDINRSRLIARTLDQSVQDKTLDANASHNESAENDDSVLNKSDDTIKDLDNTETNKESIYAADVSEFTNNTTDMQHSKNSNNFKESTVEEFSNRESKVALQEDEDKPMQTIDYSENECDAISVKKYSAPRGTYFIRNNEIVDDDEDLDRDVMVKNSDPVSRGTYYVKDPQCSLTSAIDFVNEKAINFEEVENDSEISEIPKVKSKVSESLVNKIMKSIKSSNGSNTSLAQFEQLEMAAKICDDTQDGRKISSGFGSINILKEKRTYFNGKSSEEALSNKFDELEELVPASQIIKEKKRKNFDKTTSGEVQSNKEDKLEVVISANKTIEDKKHYFDETNTKIISSVRLDNVRDFIQATKTFEDKKKYFDESVSKEIKSNKLDEVKSLPPSKTIKDKKSYFDESNSRGTQPHKLNYEGTFELPTKSTKEKMTYFDETKSKEIKLDQVEELKPSIKNIKDKKTYFDDIGDNSESAANKIVNEVASGVKSQANDTRSPSIVKDEIVNDYKPSTIQKLLGESFTRQPDITSSVNKIVYKKHDSVDIFEGLDSPITKAKVNEKDDVVKNVKKSIERLVLDQKSASKFKGQIEREAIPEETCAIASVPIINVTLAGNNVKVTTPEKIRVSNMPQQKDVEDRTKIEETITGNNTIEEFDILCKDLTTTRATEFEMLVQEVTTTSTNESKVEETKYNLRHKTHSKTENVKFAKKVEKEGFKVVMESNAKCESSTKLTKRSLRLRRLKNTAENMSDQEGDKLKDIVNLQKEFSDVTMDVPAPVKEVKDIPSPEKIEGDAENVPPSAGIQSCPSKRLV